MAASQTNRPPGGCLRYSLRGLFLVTTGVCIWLAYVFNQVRGERQAVQAVVAAGGTVAFDYHFERNSKEAQPPGPEWLRRLIGDELFRTPRHVEIRGDGITDAFLDRHLAGLTGTQVLLVDSPHVGDIPLAEVSELDSVYILVLRCPRITDAGLEDVAAMRQLTALELDCSKVTDAGIQQLSSLTELKRLRLISTRVTAEGIRSLAPLTELGGVTCFRDPLNERLAAQLTSRMNVELIDVPLVDGLELMSQMYQVPIDWKDVLAIRRSQRINLERKARSLRESLDEVLGPAELDYYLESQTIHVAPREEAALHRAGEKAFRETFPNLEWLQVDW